MAIDNKVALEELQNQLPQLDSTINQLRAQLEAVQTRYVKTLGAIEALQQIEGIDPAAEAQAVAEEVVEEAEVAE